MQLLEDGTVIASPTDLSAAATCEFALLRDLDGRLGRADPVDEPADAMLQRAASLGEAHEQRVLDAYIAELGVVPVPREASVPGDVGGVLVLERPRRGGEALAAAIEATIDSLRAGVDVVAQGAVGDQRFAGFADFLVREPDGSGGQHYVVEDTKLARRAKVPALLQIAAYADLIEAAGVPVAPVARLRLGTGEVAEYRLDDLVPVYRLRRARLESIIDEHLAETDAVRWADERYSACGTCPTCEVEVHLHRDLRLVAGMRGIQRGKLRAAGITTIDELASSEGPVLGMSARTLANLRDQARLQVLSDEAPIDGQSADGIRVEVFDPGPIQALPAPSPGDIFFDFEGDPLWTGAHASDWGLEYLFGMLDTDGAFTYLWADDRAAEKRALQDFLDRVRQVRAQYPDMHVYHYAPYEVTALKRLVITHQTGEDYLDELLRAGVFVDLYAVVRRSVRVGQPSYSIKKLEPLYMGDQLRTGEVTNAADSIAEYADYCAAAEAGDEARAQVKRAGILDYNEYDCLSTLRLRDWLRERVAGLPVPPADLLTGAADDEAEHAEDGPGVFDVLLEYAEPGPDGRTAQQQGAALMHAATGFHRREDRPYWWAHFDRLQTALDEWPESREAMVIDEVEVVRDWYLEGRQSKGRRDLEVRGAAPAGSELLDGKVGFALYAHPAPLSADTCAPDSMGTIDVVDSRVLDAGDADGVVRLHLTESASDPHGELPVALSVGRPPHTKALVEAIEEAASRVVRAWPRPAADAAWDILCRTPPRTADGGPLDPVVDHDFVAAITSAVRRLDRSYVAVQGPPGTGKTYTGARVIMNLVEDGWKVGVVAQSHAVVENMLRGAIKAGLDPELVGKKSRSGAAPPWRALKDNRATRAFLEGDRGPGQGRLFGGTAWDFSNSNRVLRDELDLLVIDEAGQFSLANTIAVAVSAQRLLLLGDPQQLPQVSQGTHPEPVDGSALGWLSDGRTLGPEFGYFLDRTFRMHPDLTRPVSTHSYEGKLAAHPVAATRALADAGGEAVEPGVRVRIVDHRGNSVESREEAEAVVEEVRRALTWTWTDARPGSVAAPRPMTPEDVLVVVPYNAQRGLITQLLAEAGLAGVRVGTVDKFQGQEAPVVIVSTTVSAAADAPRGMGFALSRNRVNVAVSRGQWQAVIVRSEALTDYLPASPDGLAELGAFIGLCAGSVVSRGTGNPQEGQ
ncbi:MAG: TM0106 family RecB-like putative nuclease [Candidatus Nanopelagicales bacterium]